METTLDAAETGAPGDSTLGLVVWGLGSPRVVHLPPTGRLVAGRGESADLALNDPTLSREHAAFEAHGAAVLVEDLGSKNGIRVEGRPWRSGLVEPGQVVELGALRVCVTILGGRLGEGRADVLERWVATELVRARQFRRPFAVVAVEGDVGSLDVALRPVDRCAEWSPRRATVLLVEMDGVTAAAHLEPWLGLDRAHRAGISTYPSDGTTPMRLIDRAAEALRGTTDASRIGRAEGSTDGASELVVESPAMHEVLRLVERFARSELPVLVRGETGVGKEEVAARIHAGSERADAPYRVINCAAIPDTLVESTLFGHVRGSFTGAGEDRRGVFEQAHGGTLFLDEVGELTLSAQAALLRVLEHGTIERVGGEVAQVDVRVVTATHHDLDARVADGGFRADLLHRLDALTLVVPPLRDRPEDLVALIDVFLARAAERTGRPPPVVDGVALQRMLDYPWPGNVRELRNALERASLVCQDDVIRFSDLPPRVRGASPATLPPPASGAGLRERLRDFEIGVIEDALRRCAGNQTEAARLLQIPRRTLVHKLGALGIGRRPTSEQS